MIFELIQNFLNELWSILAQMGPYLLFGFLVAGILSVYIQPAWVERHLGGSGIMPAIKASIFGVPLPLCSCGVIPVSAGIYRHGASKSATVSFLLSTPQTGIDSIFVTYGMLGPIFAIFRPIVALFTGIIGGSIVQVVDNNSTVKSNSTSAKKEVPEIDISDNSHKIYQIFKYGFVNLPKDIGKALFVGILIAAAMGVLVPPEYLGGLIGTGFISILILMAAGVPVYVCATASVPIAAGFLHMGASPGAALAFLIAGPATNAATFTTILKVMGKTTAAIYLSTVAVSAVLSGLLLNWLVPTIEHIMPNMGSHAHHTDGLSLVFHLSAIVLIAVVGFSYYYKPKPLNQKENISQDYTELIVMGMTCSHCEANVKNTAGEGKGVETVNVDLESGQVLIKGEAIDTKEIISAINSLGYQANLVK